MKLPVICITGNYDICVDSGGFMSLFDGFFAGFYGVGDLGALGVGNGFHPQKEAYDRMVSQMTNAQRQYNGYQQHYGSASPKPKAPTKFNDEPFIEGECEVIDENIPALEKK